MKNNSLGTKILMTAVTLALLAYFGLQIGSYFSSPLMTTLAYSYQVEESVSLSGYVVRQEQLLTDDGGGLLRLQREEGERVSRGGAVASVYADQASLDRQAEISSLESRIEQLEYAQQVSDTSEASKKLDAQILRSILEHRRCLSADRLAKAESYGQELRALVLKRDYTYTGSEDLSAQLETLQSQLKELKAQTAKSVRTITAPVSGLYSAVVDGYESVLTPDMLSTLTPSSLSALRPEETSSGVGKLILGDTWYYAAAMSAADAKSIQDKSDALSAQGKTLTLRFAKSVERDLPVTVAFLGAEENGRCVVVFQSRSYLSQLTLLRQQSAQVIWNSEEGIRVPKEALRIDTQTTELADGTTQESRVSGVYCVVGMEARFKPVEVLYNGSSFLLVRANAPSDRENLRLRPGDEVIITANDLYDGKVVGQKG